MSVGRFAVLLFLAAAIGPARASSTGTVLAFDAVEEFQKAVAEFDRGQELLGSDLDGARRSFRSAAERFKRISESGVVNGRLEFNTGNAYLQAGDTGRAILHYRRAQKLIPRDPLLADNLAEAKRRCVTNVASKRSDEVLRNVLFWFYETSARERITAAVAMFAAFWFLLTIRNFVPRRWPVVAAVVLAIGTATSAGSVAVQRWSDRTTPAGVVLAMDVVVLKGPGSGYQRQFEQPLQPGVEFRRLESRAGWWNILLPDGQRGWIDASSSELIPM